MTGTVAQDVPKNGVRKSADGLFGVFRSLSNAVLDLGGDDEVITRIVTRPGVANKLARVLLEKDPLIERTEEHGWWVDRLDNQVIAIWEIGGKKRWIRLGCTVWSNGPVMSTPKHTRGYVVEVSAPMMVKSGSIESLEIPLTVLFLEGQGVTYCNLNKDIEPNA